MSDPVVQTAGLGKVFGRTVAVDGLNLIIPRGEVFGFLGPNGAGKTTTIKMLTGLIFPTGGKATILARRCRRPKRWAR